MRIEKDFLGEVQLPSEVLYGINSWRASVNFTNQTRFSLEWFKAVGVVKQACYTTAYNFIVAATEKYPGKKLPAGADDQGLMEKLAETAAEVADGKYFDQFIVPAIQGGAGTAINMNINEIIANATLQKSGHHPGDYHIIDPFIHANVFQSTNDVIPTALRVAIMKQLLVLETTINQHRSAFETHEKESRGQLRLAYTQMQQSIPSSFGLMFSSWADALSRDWWRVSKCFERIKTVNLGGGATGTGMAIPRYFIMEVTNQLRNQTQLPLARSENHTDSTQNLDSLVEAHAILKAHAVNLEKIASDLRLLASDMWGNPDISLPERQTGSSIIPGKVNPVINEFVIGCAQKVYANDILVSNLAGQGCLELNAYLPVIGHAMLESLHLLIKANDSMLNYMITGLTVHPHAALQKLFSSPTITTALIPLLGYNKASELSFLMKKEKLNIFQANQRLKLLDESQLNNILSPENLLKLGYSLNDI